MNFILMQFGFPPVIIKTQDKENYFAVLRLADAGNLEAFVTYIAENLNVSLEIMIAGAKGENIEEEDDLDKEIALLEQKINNINNTDNKKTNENIKRLIVSIEKTTRLLNTKSILFSKMYNQSDFEIIIKTKSNKQEQYGTYHPLNDFLKTGIHNSNTEKIDWIEIKSTFNNFTNINFNSFSYKSTIYFYLGRDNRYEVSLDFLKNLIFKKNYGEQLTDSEINEIVKSEMKRHKEFIEQKIAEKENK
jgi:hypothetical protein